MLELEQKTIEQAYRVQLSGFKQRTIVRFM